MGGDVWDRELRLVEVVRNVVTERSLPRACDTVEASAPNEDAGSHAAREAAEERDRVPAAAGVRAVASPVVSP